MAWVSAVERSKKMSQGKEDSKDVIFVAGSDGGGMLSCPFFEARGKVEGVVIKDPQKEVTTSGRRMSLVRAYGLESLPKAIFDP